MSGAELTLEFLEGGAAANAGADRDACPYYATSNAADAWHAGFEFHSRGNVNDVLQVTKGRGYRLNLWTARRQIVALVDWNHPSLTDHPPVSFDSAGAPNSNKAERDRKLVELAAAAPLQSKGRAVEDAAHLPLFVAANEPTLF